MIFVGFFATFHSCSNGKVLFNGVTNLWETMIIGGYEDRSVSIFLTLVIKGVTTWNFGSFIDLSLDVLSFVSMTA